MESTTEETPKNTISKDIIRLSSHEEICEYLKKRFDRLDNTSAKNLSTNIISYKNSDIEVRDFKAKYKGFVTRNKTRFVTKKIKDKEFFYLRPEIVKILRVGIFDLLDKIGKSIKDIDDIKDEEKWSKSQVNGRESYEITKLTTFQDIREKIDKEGKDVSFYYSFKKPDLEVLQFKNKTTLQMIDVHINNNGEAFGFPLKYVYMCTECNSITTQNEYEVASSPQNRIKCPELIEVEKNGSITYKRCGQGLIPDTNRTETKDSYIYDISFKDDEGNIQRGDAISFIKLPRGAIRVVLHKIPRAYGKQLVYIADFQPLETDKFPIPKKLDDEHYMFTLLRTMDEYIKTKARYVHYGCLPMKMAFLLQFAARYTPFIENNYNIALSGSMSSGKSALAKYQGFAYYAQNCLASNATSISIPKLRGTMETFHLFGKDHRYQYTGLLGEKDLIIIDEVKEAPDVKNNLKQFGLEKNYDYSKQGGNNQSYERTAHLVITQNIDTKHLDQYTKEIYKIYTSSELGPVDNNEEPKLAWSFTNDLTLPLYKYDNKYLRYAIRKVRDDYARNQVNWVDGSEMALKQRFVFYFYMSSDKSSEELTKVLRENADRKKIKDINELVRIMDSTNLAEMFMNRTKLFHGKNDLAFFKKVDELLVSYHKRSDARTKEMMYDILKLIRIIDNRDYCNDEDLKILQYIIESIDNKVEVVDTHEFKVNGPQNMTEEIKEGIPPSQAFDYNADLGDFKNV